MKTKNITIVDAHSDDNKGDLGILIGLIDGLLNSAQQENIRLQLSIISSFSQNLDYHHRHLQRLYPTIVCYPAIASMIDINSTQTKKTEYLSRTWNILKFLHAYFVVHGYRYLGKYSSTLLFTRRQQKILSVIATSDLVISRGGHMLHSLCRIRPGMSFSEVIRAKFRNAAAFSFYYFHVLPLVLAQQRGIKTAISAQSIGPITLASVRKNLTKFLPKVDNVAMREPLSLTYVHMLCGPEHHAQLIWDTAFNLESQSLPETIKTQLKQPYIAISVRRWYVDKDTDTQRYLQSITALVNHISKNFPHYQIVMIAQGMGPTPLEDDREVLKMLQQKIINPNCIFIDDDLMLFELMSIYQNSKLLIGTRFHSVIFALSAGVPAIAIAYYGTKAEGIMQMLNLEEYVLDMSTITPDVLVDQFVKLNSRQQEYRHALSAMKLKIKPALQEYFQSLIKL